MIGQYGLMESSQLGKFAQIFLDNRRIVLQKEPLQVFWNKFVQAEEGTF